MQVVDRSLLEARTHLVDADHADVGAGVHRPGRQVVVERKVRSPCLVDDERLARYWHTCAMASRSAQVPYGLGLTISAPGGIGITLPRLFDLHG